MHVHTHTYIVDQDTHTHTLEQSTDAIERKFLNFECKYFSNASLDLSLAYPVRGSRAR